MKQYHINFYLDAEAQGPSQGANYTSTDELSALAAWQNQFDTDAYPNRKFISMRVIE